jgi:hypothetical protein
VEPGKLDGESPYGSGASMDQNAFASVKLSRSKSACHAVSAAIARRRFGVRKPPRFGGNSEEWRGTKFG